MADERISALAPLQVPAGNDRIPIVDRDDPTMSASGTTKYTTPDWLFAEFGASLTLQQAYDAQGPGTQILLEDTANKGLIIRHSAATVNNTITLQLQDSIGATNFQINEDGSGLIAGDFDLQDNEILNIRQATADFYQFEPITLAAFPGYSIPAGVAAVVYNTDFAVFAAKRPGGSFDTSFVETPVQQDVVFQGFGISQVNAVAYNDRMSDGNIWNTFEWDGGPPTTAYQGDFVWGSDNGANIRLAVPRDGVIDLPLHAVTKEYADANYEPLGGGGGGGEANTSSNAGAGEGLALAKVGVDLPFKSLVAGTNITLSSTATEITINAAGGGGGLNDVLDDLTPQLGGDLDVNGNALFDSTSPNLSILENLIVSGSLEINGSALDMTNGDITNANGIAWSGNLRNQSSGFSGDVLLTSAGLFITSTDGVNQLRISNREAIGSDGRVALRPKSSWSDGTLEFDYVDDRWEIDGREVLTEYMYPVWAEENSTLGNNTYEWAFGNGANTPSNAGITIYVPTGYEAHIVAMSATTNNAGGTSVIEANINGVLQGANCNVTLSGRSGTNDSFTPVALSNGDRLTFRTTTAGTNSSPSTVTAWIRVRST